MIIDGIPGMIYVNAVVVESGMNPANKNLRFIISLSTENERAHAGRDDRAHLARPNKCPGANGGREKTIFLFSSPRSAGLATIHTRLIHTLLKVKC